MTETKRGPTALWRDRAGSLPLTFALALPVALVGASVALSYASNSNLKNRLTAAADSAVLSVVSQPGTQVGDKGDDDDDKRQTMVDTYFRRNAGADYAYVKSTKAKIAKNNGTITATLGWTAQTSTVLSGLTPIKALAVSGTSSATSAEPLYVDFYILIDASGSMGIGASAKDQQIMQNGMGCTFACHIYGNDTTAHDLGATLRFDVVKDAVSSMIAAAKSRSMLNNEFRFAIYKFSNRLTKVRPLTPDNSAVSSALSSMTLDGDYTKTGQEGAGTNFNKVLADMQKEVGTPGDGKTPGKPLVFFLIFTDGVGDDAFEQGGGSWIKDPLFSVHQPVVQDNNQYITGFDPSLCKPFKDKGISVMTLDIGYVIPPNSGDQRYIDIGSVLKPKIMENMRACASRESFAHQAEAPSEIQRAITAMFEAAYSKARLTH